LAAVSRRLAAAHGLLADAVVGAQFARLVLSAGPGGGAGTAFGAVLRDTAAGTTLVQDRAQGQYRLGGAQAGGLAQLLDAFGVQRFAFATPQVARQFDPAIADALEPADQEALRVPQAANLAIAALADHHAEPAVAATAADHRDVVEAGRAVVQFDAGFQALDDLVGHLAVHAAQVFALHAALGVHQAVGQLAVGGQQQQAGGDHQRRAGQRPDAPQERHGARIPVP